MVPWSRESRPIASACAIRCSRENQVLIFELMAGDSWQPQTFFPPSWQMGLLLRDSVLPTGETRAWMEISQFPNLFCCRRPAEPYGHEVTSSRSLLFTRGRGWKSGWQALYGDRAHAGLQPHQGWHSGGPGSNQQAAQRVCNKGIRRKTIFGGVEGGSRMLDT